MPSLPWLPFVVVGTGGIGLSPGSEMWYTGGRVGILKPSSNPLAVREAILTFDEAITTFLAAWMARGRSARTVTWYGDQLRGFVAWLAGQGINGSAWCRAEVIERYLAEEAGRVSPATVHARYRALHVFFAFLVERRLLAESPMAPIKPPKVPKHSPRRTSLEEYDTLLESIPQESWIDLRDRLALNVLFLCGLRVSEVAALTAADFDIGNTLVIVRRGKGGDERLVPLLPPVAQAFVAYILVRPAWTSPHLMLAASGGALQPAGVLKANGIRLMLRRRCKAAGLDYLNPHSFRHGLAMRMLNAGADMSLVQKVLGHKAITTTATVYAQWLTEGMVEQFAAVMERSSRRKRKST